ncbi:hypothetical protein [Hydrogenophaga sp.]|nr:hypothetical protein [Hydrogenophaga sp.]
MLNLGRPVIAAIDGPAMGAGFSMGLTTDMVLGRHGPALPYPN